MFGLLEPNPDKFNTQQKERYKSVYCGLCHGLRNNYNNVSRFCLTFDLTFLVLLLSALYEPEEQTDYCRCVFNKGKKTPFIENEYTEFAADLTVMFAYEKLLDDIADEGKLKHKVSKAALENQYRKVQNKLPEICSTTKKAMEEIRRIEKESMKGFNKTKVSEEKSGTEIFNMAGDEIAKIFGYIMAIVFSYKADDNKDTLAKFGANLGRAIYYLDAAIDLEEDINNSCFNPYLLMYKDKIVWSDSDQNTPNDIFNNNFREMFYEKIKHQILVLIGMSTQELEQLKFKKDKDLIENILYEGIWSRFNYKIHKSENKVQ